MLKKNDLISKKNIFYRFYDMFSGIDQIWFKIRDMNCITLGTLYVLCSMFVIDTQLTSWDKRQSKPEIKYCSLISPDILSQTV